MLHSSLISEMLLTVALCQLASCQLRASIDQEENRHSAPPVLVHLMKRTTKTITNG